MLCVMIGMRLAANECSVQSHIDLFEYGVGNVVRECHLRRVNKISIIVNITLISISK